MGKEIATLANGCFWCTEAIFQQLKGVSSVRPGYSGGTTENPTYYQVATGKTGHAESIQIEFDPQIISYQTILEVFWYTHDPTTLNRQGADAGTEYRSAIFYHTPEQKMIAEKLKSQLDQSKVYENPIVTEITPFTKFYPAEDYHLNFYNKNKGSFYCKIVIDPKIQKLLSKFGKHMKDK
jgi:peptide-methionine (S)-S-oxide reductase